MYVTYDVREDNYITVGKRALGHQWPNYSKPTVGA